MMIVSVSGYANSNVDTSLAIQPGYPADMEPQAVKTETGYQYQQKPSYPVQKQIQNRNKSLSIEYTAQKGKFENDIDADLNGVAIGLSSSPDHHGFWSKFEYLKNNDYDADYYELSIGAHYNFIYVNNFYLTGTAGLGFGWAKVDGFDNSSFFTVPLGLEAGFNFTPSLSLFGGVGYKWAWDVSSSTKCNDGTTSNSTGSGACSWHDGVNSSTYTIGDFDGVTYKAGLRYNF
ncbi:hypothetical protein BJI46_05500 [Acinetobacter qingfengensis]|uniref:Porin family protein n=2 Tax=Acinetobacter qingfengensis TaxID=1262585 RepID=A0A1E7QYR2_9GAMM|nr:hypothetical protein BJI46_05500 [Acinetobacter qingfengensis]